MSDLFFRARAQHRAHGSSCRRKRRAKIFAQQRRHGRRDLGLVHLGDTLTPVPERWRIGSVNCEPRLFRAWDFFTMTIPIFQGHTTAVIGREHDRGGITVFWHRLEFFPELADKPITAPDRLKVTIIPVRMRPFIRLAERD